MSGPADEATAPATELRVDRWIAPYFRDMSLWPVMLVVTAHLVLGIALALLDATRHLGRFGIAVLLGAAVGTAAALRADLRRGRLGVTSRFLLVMWAGGALTAWAADHWGLY